MPEELEGVKQPSETPTDEQEVVNEEVVESDQPQQTEVPDTQEVTPAPLGQEEVDEMGVPYKNRYMEAIRKLEKEREFKEQILQKLEQLQNNVGTSQPKYTIDELTAFAAETENPAHRQWALAEIRKLERQESAKIVEEKLTEFEKKRQAETLKQQALAEVQKAFPDAFVKDPTGAIVGWNNNNPLTQRIAYYMQDPEVASNPRGLIAAAKMAYADIALMQGKKSHVKTKQLQSELKSLQKKTFVEGGGSGEVPEPTPIRAAVQKASQTGDLKDAAVALKEMMKAKGLIK